MYRSISLTHLVRKQSRRYFHNIKPVFIQQPKGRSKPTSQNARTSEHSWWRSTVVLSKFHQVKRVRRQKKYKIHNPSTSQHQNTPKQETTETHQSCTNGSRGSMTSNLPRYLFIFAHLELSDKRFNWGSCMLAQPDRRQLQGGVTSYRLSAFP